MKVTNPLDLAKSALAIASNDDDTERRRVVELFRNRAELKKAYSELQDELYRLKDRLKQQEGATARVQEMLSELERRLGDEETAWPTLVFFQLRRLWSFGGELLKAFASDLEAQQVERERRAYHAEVNRRRFALRQRTEAALRDCESRFAGSTAELARLEKELAGARMPWHHFRRKKLETSIRAARAAHAALEGELEEARGAHELALHEEEGAFPGLSVEARRGINAAVIAYAEVLCARLARSPVLALARTASQRREPLDDYGDRKECESLMNEIARARALVQQRGQLATEVKTRTERIARIARYRGADDAVPVPESLAADEGDALQRLSPGKEDMAVPNVLVEDSFELFKALVR